jgi:hypothetical protein
VGQSGFDLAGGRRSAPVHLVQHGLDQPRLLVAHLAHPAPRLGLGGVHPTGEQRPDGWADERCLVRPVFD